MSEENLLIGLNVEELLREDYRQNLEKAKKLIGTTGKLAKECLPEVTHLINSLNIHETAETVKLSTNGYTIFFHPKTVMEDFKKGGYKILFMQYMHVILHILMGHVKNDALYTHKNVWDHIADLEVQHLLDGMFGHAKQEKKPYATNYYRAKKVRDINASTEEANKETHSDEHYYWRRIKEEETHRSGDAMANQSETDEALSQVQILLFGGELSGDPLQRSRQLKQLFRALEGAGMKVQQEIGVNPGTSAKWHEAVGEKLDWREVLRNILQNYICSEETDDSLDRELYMYGLDLYGDVALVDPAWEENYSLKAVDIYIAIDTSASCDMEVADQFLGEMEALLLALKPYMECSGHVHMMECDTCIQHEWEMENRDIYPGCMKIKELHGYGGTNFRPVFQRIAEEQKEREKEPILFYLTDGWGVYPETGPNHTTVFVIPGMEPCNRKGEWGRNDIPDYVKAVYMEGKNEGI